MRILFVDDEELMRNVSIRLLKRRGHIVDTASDGDDAYEKFMKEPYDLLVCDIVMPRLTGIELAKSVLLKYPETGVLLISGYSFDQLNDAEELSGKTVFLQKPYSNEDLQRTMDEAFQMNQKK